MVFNQIFSWTSQIHWIPIQERLSNFIQFILWNLFRSILFAQQNEIPEIGGNIFMSNTQNTNLRSIEVSLQQVSKSIESEVNSWVRQWFNQILFIKWKFSSQAEWSWASPFFQPVDGINQIIVENFTVTFKLGLYIIKDFLLPFFMTIVNIPLLAISNYTFVTSSWNNLSSWFKIFQSMTWFNQIFSNESFSLSYFETFIISNKHSSFMETFFIAFLFCLIQKNSIVLTFNFQILAYFQSWQITISWNVNNLDWLNVDHFLSQTIFLSHRSFLSQIWNSHPIIRWVTWNTSNNSCAFIHTNSHHW